MTLKNSGLMWFKNNPSSMLFKRYISKKHHHSLFSQGKGISPPLYCISVFSNAGQKDQYLIFYCNTCKLLKLLTLLATVLHGSK